MADENSKEFAKGTITNRNLCRVYYGSAETVEIMVGGESGKYKSIYFYNTKEELDKNINTDMEYFKDDMGGVEFVNVDVLAEHKIS